MTPIILAALGGAFVLAFGVRVLKWAATTVYALAPYVVAVVVLFGLMMALEQVEQKEVAQQTASQARNQ